MNETSLYVLLLAALGATSVGMIAWMVTRTFDGIGRDFRKHRLGRMRAVFYLMIPPSRAFGRKTADILQIPILGRYVSWARKNLRLAGMDHIFEAEAYVGSHLFLMLLGVALPLMAMPLLDISPAIAALTSLLLGGASFFAPFFFLRKAIEDRKKEAFLALPGFLDLLTLLTEAGAEFSMAFRTATPMMKPSVLRLEAERMCRQLDVNSPVDRELRNLAERLDIPEMRSFVAALLQKHSNGSPIKQQLRIQAEIMRKRRVALAEEKAGRAPVLATGAVVVFLFPSIFVILITALYLSAMGQF